MTDEEQKKIFSKNLNKYLALNNKTQKEVAKMIGVSPQTFNTWCQGIAIPRMRKVQSLADYFNIKKSDLIDEKPELNAQDERDIKKDLDSLVAKLTNKEYGSAAFDGDDIPEEDLELFVGQLELMLRRLKSINKKKYNPHKNNAPELNAAHARTDKVSTTEGQAHDNAIMNDDSEWE